MKKINIILFLLLINLLTISCFSFTDQNLVVLSLKMGEEIQIYTYSLETKELEQITTNPGGYLPKWFSNKEKIIFKRDIHPDDITQDIFLIDIEDKKEIRLTNNNSSWNPHWNSTGNKIVYNSQKGLDGAWLSPQVFIMNPDGSEKKRISKNNNQANTNPRISPDGNKMIFQEGNRIVETTINASDFSYLNKDEIARYPKWSPNGEYISFLIVRRDESSKSFNDICVIDSEKNKKIITKNKSVLNMKWSPDGNSIIYLVKKDKHRIFYVIDKNGLNEKQIITQDKYITHFNWSPDGKKIIFIATNDNNADDLYIINKDGTGLKKINLPENSHILGVDW